MVIPGGMTAYLQSGDISYYKPFKDEISKVIEAWKHSDQVSYTKNGNPRPPTQELVSNWIRAAWNAVSPIMVQRGLVRGCFTKEVNEWFISRHDVYGEQFLQKFSTYCKNVEVPIGDILGDNAAEDDPMIIDDD